jgi:hypothetical protein
MVPQFVKNEDADADGCGSKWSLTAIWRHLSAQGLDVELIKRQIHEIAVKVRAGRERRKGGLSRAQG